MKRAFAIAAVTLMILGAGAVFAGGHGFGHHRAMKAMGPGGGPGSGMAGHLMRGLYRLDLSDEQWDQIRSIMEEARPGIQEQREAIRTVREQLRDLDPAAFDEATVRAIAKKLAAPIEELAVLHQRVRAQVYSVLTPEQREELAQMRRQMEQRRQRMRDCLGFTAADGELPPPPPAE
jgi:Spy/CpxP family protein refolding chaperone